MATSFFGLPLLAEVLSEQGVIIKPLRAGVGQYLELIEELLAETDAFAEPYQVLELSDRRQEVATFYALLLAG